MHWNINTHSSILYSFCTVHDKPTCIHVENGRGSCQPVQHNSCIVITSVILYSITVYCRYLCKLLTLTLYWFSFPLPYNVTTCSYIHISRLYHHHGITCGRERQKVFPRGANCVGVRWYARITQQALRSGQVPYFVLRPIWVLLRAYNAPSNGTLVLFNLDETWTKDVSRWKLGEDWISVMSDQKVGNQGKSFKSY